MRRIVDALEGLFAAATTAGGDLAETARFTLANVEWTCRPKEPEPAGNPIVDLYLAAACANAGPDGSSTRILAEALLAESAQLQWRTPSKDRVDGPDMAAFARNFSSTSVIGEAAALLSNKVKAGFSLQAPDTYYPPHAHVAEESYWIVGGDGDWRVDAEPWFAVAPGDAIYHASEARHAMQTNRRPLLAVWLWTSHLESKVLTVRD